MQNEANSFKQIERLQNRYAQPKANQPPGAAAGEFR
jgi:hypothetical protein